MNKITGPSYNTMQLFKEIGHIQIPVGSIQKY